MMGRKGHRAPPAPSTVAPGSRTSTFRSEQRDRSLTVMIPRAKYRAPPPQQMAPPTPSSLMTMSTFGPEQKLLNYLTVERANTPDNKQVSKDYFQLIVSLQIFIFFKLNWSEGQGKHRPLTNEVYLKASDVFQSTRPQVSCVSKCYDSPPLWRSGQEHRFSTRRGWVWISAEAEHTSWKLGMQPFIFSRNWHFSPKNFLLLGIEPEFWDHQPIGLLFKVLSKSNLRQSYSSIYTLVVSYIFLDMVFTWLEWIMDCPLSNRR
jgi:hypothetical protein